jgi:hypothetical protein
MRIIWFRKWFWVGGVRGGEVSGYKRLQSPLNRIHFVMHFDWKHSLGINILTAVSSKKIFNHAQIATEMKFGQKGPWFKSLSSVACHDRWEY